MIAAGLCVDAHPHQWTESNVTHSSWPNGSTARAVRELYCPNCDTLISVPYYDKTGRRMNRGGGGN